MAWSKVTIRQPYEGSHRYRSLPEEFHKIYLSEGEPKDAALFSRSEIHRGYQCHYYFSPVATLIAAQLVRRYNGVECAPPEDVTFVLGDLDVADGLRGEPEE